MHDFVALLQCMMQWNVIFPLLFLFRRFLFISYISFCSLKHLSHNSIEM